MKSPTLLILQFSLLGSIIFNTGKTILLPDNLLLLSPAVLLAGWAILSMRKSRFRISPVPADDASLVISGPYKLIRHPMYSSILLFVTGLLIIRFSISQLIAVIVLALVLLVKMKWEELMLSEKFPEYKSYMQHTKNIIPFIF